MRANLEEKSRILNGLSINSQNAMSGLFKTAGFEFDKLSDHHKFLNESIRGSAHLEDVVSRGKRSRRKQILMGA